MPTEAVIFDRKITSRAARMAEQGYNGTYIFRDQGSQGLSLRVRNQTAFWVVKYKDFTRTIGVLHPNPSDMPITAVSKARELAANVRRVLKTTPSNASRYIEHIHGGSDHDGAISKLQEDVPAWTFRQCVAKTIEVKSDPENERMWSENTLRDYQYIFGLPEWRGVLDRPSIGITSADIEKVRDSIKMSGRTSTANKTIAYTRAVFNFCSRHYSGVSGLNTVVPWWAYLSTPYSIAPRQRSPSISDIVRTLILAEEYLEKPLPGRKIASRGTDPRTLAGLWWIVLTGQRAGAGLSLKTSDLVQDQKEAPWHLAAWSAETMKTRRAFILPVPKRAWDHIAKFRKSSHEQLASNWAFPSSRGTQVHVSASGVYRILYRLSGYDQKTVKKARGKSKSNHAAKAQRNEPVFRNLLAEAGVPWWTSHDIRRSLTSCMNENGIPGGSSAILAHEMDQAEFLIGNPSRRDRETFAKSRASEITRKAYGADCLFLPIKKQAMEIWTNAVLDEYERQKSATDAVD